MVPGAIYFAAVCTFGSARAVEGLTAAVFHSLRDLNLKYFTAAEQEGIVQA